jgi:putative tricarboxylic transport membrane protein
LTGYLFWKLEIPIPPLVLALILGGTTEQSFRNAMTIAGNDLMFFVEKPISLTLLLLAAASIVFSIYKQRKVAKS